MVHADVVYLRHILDAILRIGEYLQGINEEEFYRKYLVQDGVIRQLEIIGEATKNIPESFRTFHPEIPWRSMAGIRDKLIHNYFGINLKVVWKTATEDLPTLNSKIPKFLI